METPKYRKVYVTMNILVKPDGTMLPRSLVWEDGRLYRIDRVRHIERRPALKTGGGGMRYTLVIHGQERYFFEDEGRWFTEVERRAGT